MNCYCYRCNSINGSSGVLYKKYWIPRKITYNITNILVGIIFGSIILTVILNADINHKEIMYTVLDIFKNAFSAFLYVIYTIIVMFRYPLTIIARLYSILKDHKLQGIIPFLPIVFIVAINMLNTIISSIFRTRKRN